MILQTNAGLSLKRVALGTLLSFLAVGCGNESLGSAEAFSPLIEERYKVLGAARLIRTQYQLTDPEYQVGELLYTEAYSSTNSVLQQILTSLRTEATLPEESPEADSSDGSGQQSTLESGIQDAIINSRTFYNYVERQICIRPENQDLCDAFEITSRSGITDIIPIPDLVKSLFTAVNESIKFARQNREDRRKELVTQYTNLLLPAFSETIQRDPANSAPTLPTTPTPSEPSN